MIQCSMGRSMVEVCAHCDVVAQMVATEREEARSGYLAAFYDELRRRQWAARAAKSDPNLNLADSLSRIDWPLLMARTRLDAALQAAGISQKDATATRTASSSLMARAQEPKVTMRSQQRNQLHAAASMLRQQQGKGIKKQKLTLQEPAQPTSNRQLKKARWIAKSHF